MLRYLMIDVCHRSLNSLLFCWSSGVHHADVACSECRKQSIEGMRWQCDNCIGINLCTLCYMNDAHSVEHTFNRFEVPGKPRLATRGFIQTIIRIIYPSTSKILTSILPTLHKENL